jgi:hypothetical protein
VQKIDEQHFQIGPRSIQLLPAVVSGDGVNRKKDDVRWKALVFFSHAVHSAMRFVSNKEYAEICNEMTSIFHTCVSHTALT